LHRYSLHYVGADRLVAEQVERVLSKPPVLRRDYGIIRRTLDWLSMKRRDSQLPNVSQQQQVPGTAQQPGQVLQIAIVSNKSPAAWVRQLASEYERLVLVIASAVVIPRDVPAIHRFQWVDLRKRSDEQLAPLGLLLWGAVAEQDREMEVIPEALARPAWPTSIGVGAKLLQIGIGVLFATLIIYTAIFLAGGSGFAENAPLIFALFFVSAALEMWAVGVTLERRMTIAPVATAIGLSLVLSTLASAGTLQAAILPLTFLGVARWKRWLPVSTDKDPAGPTLAIPAWSVWSRHLFWVAVPLLVVLPPFAVLALVEALLGQLVVK
jgi:hypothetical protein